MTELLLSTDVAKEGEITPAAVSLAAAQGRLRTALRTPGGVRLFSREAVSARLKGVLEMRRTDPKGDDHPPDAYVFGTVTGQPVLGFKRAWQTAVLKVHGHKGHLRQRREPVTGIPQSP